MYISSFLLFSYFTILDTSPNNDAENLPSPGTLSLNVNSTILNVPFPLKIALIVASPMSIMQNVPCATVSIVFTVGFLKGSQYSHKSPKLLFSFSIF